MACWRLLRFALHLGGGLATAALIYPFAEQARRDRLKQRWSRQVLKILGLRLRLCGELRSGHLLVANHISWIDIFVINAVCPTAFVSKAEVRQWPLAGWLSARTDTLFIDRSRRHQVQHIAHQMAERLAQGRSVSFFPEGTTSEGEMLLPFHAALFQPAVSAGVAVQPVAIRYGDARGQRSRAPAYAGDTGFGQCLWATLTTPGLVVEVDGLEPLASAGRERRVLARDAEAAIAGRLGLPSPERN